MQERIQADLKSAMLAGDSLRVEVIKGLKAAIHNHQIAAGHDLKDEEITAVVKKEVKKRREAAELYAKSGLNDRQAKELDEAKILQAYLPEQLSDEQLKQLVDSVKQDLGPEAARGALIQETIKRAAGSADGKRVSQLIN